MIVDEDKGKEEILVWDDEIRGLRVRRERIRMIVEEKVKEIEGGIIEKVRELGFEVGRILTGGQIEYLVDVIARDIYDFLIDNKVDVRLIFAGMGREFFIKRLNEIFERKIREELDKQGKEVEEEIEKMKN
jgi:hypothetical protein